MTLHSRLARLEMQTGVATFRFQVWAEDATHLETLIEDCMLKAGPGQIVVDYTIAGQPAGSLSLSLGRHDDRLAELEAANV